MTFQDPYAAQREQLAQMIREKGLRDPAVLDAIRETPRHLFVPEDQRERAYDDNALPIGENQTISQPSLVALMTSLLSLNPNDSALEIGTGSGYQTAILARLCRQVVSIERIETLSLRAQAIHQQLGLENILHVVGDGTLGYPALAPYKGIIVTAGATEIIPPPLLEQLSSEEGHMALPLGDRESQWLTLVVKRGESLFMRRYGQCTFVPLLGEYGW